MSNKPSLQDRVTPTHLVVMLAVGLAIGVGIGMFFFGGGGDTRHTDHEQASEASAKTKPTTWTCSMHPQIKLPEEGQCPICFMDLIPLEDSGGSDDGPAAQLRMTENAMKLARIGTTPVRREWASVEVGLVGKLDYDETRVKTIAARFPGRLERLFVDYTGIRVDKGDHMVQIYSPELRTAEAELLEAVRTNKRLGSGASSYVRESSQATIEAAREKLRLWGLSPWQIERIEKQGELSDRMTLYAPAGGIVIEKNATEGAYMQTGTAIYKIADLDRLWLELEAYESDLEWLRYGQEVTFAVEARPGETFTGRIAYIDPFLQEKKRTVRVRVNVDNSDRRLKPGMFARATVSATINAKSEVIDQSLEGKWISPMHPEIIKDGPGTCDVCGMDLVPAEELGFVSISDGDGQPPLIIPRSAPLITGKRAVVYVKKPNTEQPTFVGREVVLGLRAGEFFVVTEGLEEGEEVVTRGAFKIDSALQIEARPSMMSPPEEHAEAQEEQETIERIDAPEAFLKELEPLFARYFVVQEKLAADDFKASKAATTDLGEVLNDFEMGTLQGEAHALFMADFKALQDGQQAMANGENLKAMRTPFKEVSDALVRIQRRFGHSGKMTHFLTHCPMAFDDRGADWLADSDDIANPYFGAEMLRCGAVMETFEGNAEPSKSGDE